MLKQMGIPLTFIGWIRTLYMNVSSEVQVNGFPSMWIMVKSGPMRAAHSPQSFSSLSQRIRQDPRICRVWIRGSSEEKMRVQAYTDDLNILC